jgi:hypothetical protein
VGKHFFRLIGVSASGISLSLLMHGCGPPPISLDSPHSYSRIRAIQRAAEENDTASIPKLIGLLESDDPAVRMLSIRTLEHMTGQTLGYDHAAPEAEREQAVDQWEDWYLQKYGKTTDEGRAELRRQRALKRDGAKPAPPRPESPKPDPAP